MKRFFLSIAAAFGVATIAQAQQVDDLGDLVVNVTPHISWNPGAGGSTANVFCYARTGAQWQNITAGTNSTTDLPQQSVRMVPGVTYSAVFVIQNSSAGPGPSGYRLQVQAPPGNSVMMMAQVNGFSIPYTPGTDFSGTIANDGAQTHTVNVSIRVLTPASGGDLGPGVARSLRPAWVPWEMSLGALRNGLPAGTLYFNLGSKAIDFNTAFSRNNLSCDATSSDVVVLGDPANGNIVRQVIAPQVCVDIQPVPNTTKIQINCYHPSQWSSPAGSDGLIPITGLTPYLSYTVQPTDSNNVTISCDAHDTTTTSVGGVARTLTTALSRTGTSPDLTWTAESWHTGATALVKTVRSRTGATETIDVRDSNSAVAMKTTNTYAPMLGDEEITQVQVGSTGANPVTTSFTYYTANPGTAGYGWESLETKTDGTWQGFEYAANGTVQMLHSPWKNADSSGFPADLGTHTALTFSADAFGQATRPASSTTTAAGSTIGQSTISYSNVSPFSSYGTTHPGLSVVKALRTDYATSGSSLVSTAQSFIENIGQPTPGNPYSSNDDFYRGLVYAVEQPDKVKQCYVQQRGTLAGSTFTISGNAGLDPVITNGVDVSATRTTVITGTSSSTSSQYTRTDGYPVDTLYLVDKKSTMEVTIRNRYGDVVHTEMYAWANNTWNQVGVSDLTYNFAHQLTGRTDGMTNATWSANYSGERKTDETDATGIVLTYTYDAADRIDTVTRGAAGPISALVTKYSYDAAGHITQQTVGYGSAETMTTNRTYDDSGRLLTEATPGPNGTQITTTRTYNPGSRQVTTTTPDTATRTEQYLADGRMDQLTGTGVVSAFYTYDVQAAGLHTKVNLATANSNRSQEFWADWLGRTVKTSRPGFAGGTPFVTQMNYGSATGLLLATTRTGYGDTLYKYDALGQLIQQGLKVDGTLTQVTSDGTVAIPTPASNDRVTDTDTYFENYSGAWWVTKTQSVYPTAGSGAAVLTSTVRTRLTNFTAPVQAEILATDITNFTADTTVSVDRSSSTVTKTTTVKDASNAAVFANNAVEVSRNGFVVSSNGFDGVTYNFGYDSLWRKNTSTDPRTGATTIEYKPGSNFASGIKGAINSSGTIGYLEQYDYNISARITTVTNALGKLSRTERDLMGNIYRQWGDTVQPVENLYDSYGQRYEMHTYQTGTFAGSAATWPGAGYTFQKTNWNYDDYSGLLTSKQDAAGKGPSYLYNLRGQVQTRTWARRMARDDATKNYPAVQTSYTYDPNTGELTKVSYNDNSTTYPGAENTAPVTYTYTRLGQINTVADGTSSDAFATTPADVRTFKYGTRSGGNVLELDAVQLPNYYKSGANARLITRLYDTAYRGAGFQVGISGTPAADLSQTYTYNTLNRFDHIDVAANGYSAATNTFTYNYYPISPANPTGTKGPLVASYACGSNFSITYAYETNRNLVQAISSAWGSTTLTRHDYTYSALGQCLTVQQSGTAYADVGTTAWNNNYDDRGELTSSADYVGGTANVGNLSYQMTGRNFTYTYDNAGNRVTSSRHGPSSTLDGYYADGNATIPGANSLNQYGARTNTYAEAAGAVSSSTASVTVSGGGQVWSTTGKQGQFWGDFAQIAGASNTAPQAMPLTITATGTFSGTSYQRTDTSKTLYFPGVKQVLQYDSDGNLLTDGIWTYTYDAENRLIGMQSVTIAGFPNKLLNFTYDYANRRVEKKVGDYNGSTYITTTWRRYVYDANNLVAEFDASGGTCGAIQRSYAWGLDLAGSLTATGGVGALLQITDHHYNTSYFPTYDANGNVASLINASTGAVAVSYEYSPFGEILRRGGATYAGPDSTIIDNPFAFSTKFNDWETGLIYYGARYYSPSLGRFINRDPVEEAGGLNLYGFCGNDGVNGVDYLGYSRLTKFLRKITDAINTVVAHFERWLGKRTHSEVHIGGGDGINVGVNTSGDVSFNGNKVGSVSGGGSGPSNGGLKDGGNGVLIDTSTGKATQIYPNGGNSTYIDVTAKYWSYRTVPATEAWREHFWANFFTFGAYDTYQQVYANTGSRFAAFNAAANPMFVATSGFHDAWTGTSYGTGNSVTRLSPLQRVGATVQGVGGVVGTVAIAVPIAKVGAAGFAGIIGDAAENESVLWRVGRHGDMPSPRPAGYQSHHGVNSVWADANVEGYRAGDAPAVLMKNDPFHNATRGVFNRFRAEIASRQGVSPGNIDWSKVSPGTAWRLAEEQFEAANVPESIREEYFRQFNAYIESLSH